MKKLYTFEIAKETEIETQTESQNEAGETVVVKKKEKQSVPHSFFLMKPSRSMSDQANLYNSVKVSEGLKNGLLSVFSLDKKYRDDGVFTEDDNRKYKELYDSLIKNVEELQELTKTPEENRTEEQKKRWKDIGEEMEATRIKLKDYESVKNNLYTHSAEFRARNLTVMWWILFLSHKEENGKELPFFAGSSLDEKLKSYDELKEKDDAFINKVIERFLYSVSFWVTNGGEKQEDFVELEKMLADNAIEQTKPA